MEMRILIQVSHPAHVHFYKNFIEYCQKQNVTTQVIARDKDITVDLLNKYNIEHEVIFNPSDVEPVGITGQIKYEFKTLQQTINFSPDVITSIGGTAASHISSITSAKSVVFTDSEAAKVQNIVTVPFADTIITPRRYSDDYGDKHIRYDGYHELAYLHPNNFEPSKGKLQEKGVNFEEPFFVVRFIAWGAQHDIGQKGLSIDEKRMLISNLSSHGNVYITSESELPEEFEPYRQPIPPHLMHDLLAEADLFVGDSQTMATEAAVLGTPAVRSNSFARKNDMSNFVELEEKYNLLYSTPDSDEAIEKIQELLDQPNLQSTWDKRRDRLLEDKIDVTEFMIDTILSENT